MGASYGPPADIWSTACMVCVTSTVTNASGHPRKLRNFQLQIPKCVKSPSNLLDLSIIFAFYIKFLINKSITLEDSKLKRTSI